MTKLQKQRWKNSLKQCAKINRYIKQGYVVLDNENYVVTCGEK